MAAEPDPYDVLGLAPGASPEEVTRAYRRLAKELHPDHAGIESAPDMAQLNAAYDLLRDGLSERQRDRLRSRAPAPPAGHAAPRPGHWLPEDTRRRLGPELLAALTPGEDVLATARTATWDSHEVLLVVTDRRLLWLRDDAISDRVRSQPHVRTTAVEVRRRGRLRRTGELRVTTDRGRRLGFGELPPAAAESLAAALRPLVAPESGRG